MYQGGEAERNSLEKENQHDKSSWTDTIAEKMATVSSPLKDRFDDIMHALGEESSEINVSGKIASPTSTLKGRSHNMNDEEQSQSEPAWTDTFKERMRTLAAPLVDRFDVHGTEFLSDVSNEMMAAIVALLLLLTVLVWKRTKSGVPANCPRARTLSSDGSVVPTRNRARSGSRELKSILRDRTKSQDGFRDSPKNPQVQGPGISFIFYETWTPPVQWSEASRQLIPHKTKSERQCKLTLNLSDGTLSGSNWRYDMDKLSIHVKPPKAGAVLELYVKGAPKKDWMEHTFQSAYEAAQFQEDLIHYQVIGESITNMYEALELVHKGSLAHDGKECVLHDDTSDNKKGAVAWDDCMRCFSGIPSVRSELERNQRKSINETDQAEATAALAEDYGNKRFLLGYVDFFRIFVPNLENKTLPRSESSPKRVVAMLGRRKQVAQAAVMVQAYVHARKVANKGWKLPHELPDIAFVKRLAYDNDVDNIVRDLSIENEYYEATVSRDVRCELHSVRHLEKAGSSTPSQYQAYSLVGSQVFKLPPEGEAHALSHTNDPVLALPSIRELVEAHPELDFFVCAFFPDGQRITIVHVFVRSLPRGVDSSFDRVMDRFVNGGVEVRERKLEVFMQLGPGASLSPLAWAALKTVSYILSWSQTRKGEAPIPVESGVDRTPFPGMNLRNYTETTHFGGCLQTDPTLPKNYVSVTTHVDADKMNMATRVLYQRLEEGGLPASVVDFTFVLEGEQIDELPERALGTIRMVHIDPAKVALPLSFSSRPQSALELSVVTEKPPARLGLITTLSTYTPRLASDLNAVWNSVMGTTAEMQPAESVDECKEEPTPSKVTSSHRADPFQAGVDALSDILSGVTVPIRRDNFSPDDVGTMESDGTIQSKSTLLPPTKRREDVVNVPVLSRTSTSDMRRYFLATNCDLKEAAVRIVESAAWRGITFPIDTQKCRVELQSGQFFQQGNDIGGDPVFYFQNMCMGPWRQDVDASVSALLHRLESSLVRLSHDNPDVRCTVIILMGRPLRKAKKKKEKKNDENSSTAAASKDAADGDGGHDSVADDQTIEATENDWNPFRLGVNPRVQPGEDYHVHSDIDMIYRLSDVLSSHYPERLKKLLLVKGGPGYLSATFGMRKYIASARTRARIVQINGASELKRFVDESELATIVGGTADVLPDAFES